MFEGPIKENSYFFPASKIVNYLNSLVDLEYYENQYIENIEQKVMIMTHDDEFDLEMYEKEKEFGFGSTWFLLDSKIEKNLPKDIDVQIHFNKETGILSDQIERFYNTFNTKPIFNRNHRLLWKSNNFDFPFMALSGILVDSTLIGTKPFRPVIDGKLLPIWELPFCITDITNKFMASYCMSGNLEVPFRKNLSPIIVASHPFDVCKRHNLNSCFYKSIDLALKYDYQIMDMFSFYKKFLEEWGNK